MIVLQQFDYRRFSIAMMAACLTTTALFYLMHLLIKTDNVEVVAAPLTHWVDFVRIPEQRVEIPHRNKADKPPEPADKPIPPRVTATVTDVYGTQTTQTVLAEPPTKFRPGGWSEGNILPLVKVQPQYPRAAISRGIEGYVVVEFDVAADGSVRNPRVIDNYPNDVFNRASIIAVMKFRYKPKVDNGKPVVVTGVQNKFTFELKGDS